jgi:hypothetical protein
VTNFFMRDDESDEFIRGYQAGLRRAQELAKELINFDDSSHVPGRLGEGRTNWDDFDAAIEQETKL